jgi:hypothetical protein
MEWYLIVVSVHISLVINELENLFIHLLTISRSLRNMYSSTLPSWQLDYFVIVAVFYVLR